MIPRGNKYLIKAIIVFIFLSALHLTFAQYSSQNSKPDASGNKNGHERYKSGNSTISDASNRNDNRYNRKDDHFTDLFEKKKNRYDRKNDRQDKKDYYNRRDRKDDYRRNDNYRRDRSDDRNRKESENYFHIDRSGRTLWDGKHWDIDDYPLKVYVKESSSRYYKSIYKDYVDYAFEVWDKADKRIDYIFVNSSRYADISVIFVENLGRKYEENYLGLTEYDMNRNNEIEFSKIQISLIKFNNEKVSDGEIKATIIHELGHAFGLGHSDSKSDIMYPYIDSDHTAQMTYDELSRGDKAAFNDVIDLGDNELYVWK